MGGVGKIVDIENQNWWEEEVWAKSWLDDSVFGSRYLKYVFTTPCNIVLFKDIHQ